MRSTASFPDSNYEMCATNPEAVKLLSGMFQDLVDANRGGKFVYLSTDEAYYVGMADNSQCREKAAAEALGSVGKLLAQFVTQVAEPAARAGTHGDLLGRVSAEAHRYRIAALAHDQWRSLRAGLRSRSFASTASGR